MLLAVDVGNTNITCGVFDGKNIKDKFRLTTGLKKTSDEYGIVIMNLLTIKGIKAEAIEAVIISSVVPDMMHSLKNAIRKYLEIEPIIVGPGVKTGISIKTDNPREVGADRIVDSVSAFREYGGSVLIVDFGTATTYDIVNEKGEFVYAVTAPGVRISADALWKQAAKLPRIEIDKPKTILAKNTITSMQAGVFFGCIGQVEYIIQKMKEEYKKDVKVVATGGLGRMIAAETDVIDVYDSELTLKGLYYIYELQEK